MFVKKLEWNENYFLTFSGPWKEVGAKESDLEISSQKRCSKPLDWTQSLRTWRKGASWPGVVKRKRKNQEGRLQRSIWQNDKKTERMWDHWIQEKKEGLPSNAAETSINKPQQKWPSGLVTWKSLTTELG